MNISVFGLGYVGVVSCACFSRDKHKVTGVDVDRTKVDLINSGKATIIEKGLEEEIQQSVNLGLLKSTQDYKEAVLNSEVSFICVGTPSLPNGAINLAYIYGVVKQIAEVLMNIILWLLEVLLKLALLKRVKKSLRIFQAKNTMLILV